MVYYFTSTVVEPSSNIYVGKDKFENEDLIKYGWEEDVCRGFLICRRTHSWKSGGQFHVDKLSSAHVYLRMSEGQAWDDLPKDLITDLAQLTKANSIEGNKKDNITVIYTPWANLKKDGSMDVGQVSFHDARKVKRVLVPRRENVIVNRLNKTKVEKKPDLKAERDDKIKELNRKQQAVQQQRRKEEQRLAQEWAEKKYQKDHAYDELFTEDNMAASSNQDRAENWEDDFM